MSANDAKMQSGWLKTPRTLECKQKEMQTEHMKSSRGSFGSETDGSMQSAQLLLRTYVCEGKGTLNGSDAT